MILTTKIVKQYPNNKPWINTTLRKLIVDKHNAFKSGDDNYHKKQADINKAIEVAKSEYKDKVERQFKTNKMKDAWKGLHLLNGQKEEEKVNSLTSTPGSAERLNNIYSRFNKIDFSKEQLLRKNKLEKIVMDGTPILIIEEVCKVLKTLNTKKATGPDKVSGMIVKECRSSLIYIIHNIFHIPLHLCRMPHLWKIGEIIPVNKKPLPKDNDLRPVTLTSILGKYFERAILPKISACTKPIMDNMQFAYLPNRSTDDATITLIHEISQHLDRGSNYARCQFIDYSSTFNTIQPHILINRLQEYKPQPDSNYSY